MAILPSAAIYQEFPCVCCCCSVSKSWPTLCDPMDCSTPGFPVLHCLPESVETRIHWVSDAIQLSNHLILCHPFLLLSLIFPSIRIFSNESVLRIRWPKYWSFSFSIRPSNEYSGLISFRIDFFDLFAVQGILKCLLQHSLKASVLPGSAFFLVQFSHLYMPTRKTIALTVWIFVDKMMPLLFNMLSRFVIAFLPRRKHLLGSTVLKGLIFLVFSHTHLALKPNLSPVAKTFRWLSSWTCKDHLLETSSLGLLKNFPGSFQYPWNIGWSIWKSNKGLHYFFSKTNNLGVWRGVFQKFWILNECAS